MAPNRFRYSRERACDMRSMTASQMLSGWPSPFRSTISTSSSATVGPLNAWTWMASIGSTQAGSLSLRERPPPGGLPILSPIAGGIEDHRNLVLGQESSHVDHGPVKDVALFLGVERMRREDLPHGIGLQDRDRHTPGFNLPLERRSHRGLAGSRQSRDPYGKAGWHLKPRSSRSPDSDQRPLRLGPST